MGWYMGRSKPNRMMLCKYHTDHLDDWRRHIIKCPGELCLFRPIPTSLDNAHRWLFQPADRILTFCGW